jgi:hypothetical protein
VLAIEPAGGQTSILLAVVKGRRTSLVAAQPTIGGKWSVSPTLVLRAGETVASFGPAGKASLFVLLGAARKRRLFVTGPQLVWRQLPSPPAGTATVAFFRAGPVQALVNAGTAITIWSLGTASHAWARAQVMHVSIQFGSSS